MAFNIQLANLINRCVDDVEELFCGGLDDEEELLDQIEWEEFCEGELNRSNLKDNTSFGTPLPNTNCARSIVIDEVLQTIPKNMTVPDIIEK